MKAANESGTIYIVLGIFNHPQRFHFRRRLAVFLPGREQDLGGLCPFSLPPFHSLASSKLYVSELQPLKPPQNISQMDSLAI